MAVSVGSMDRRPTVNYGNLFEARPSPVDPTNGAARRRPARPGSRRKAREPRETRRRHATGPRTAGGGFHGGIPRPPSDNAGKVRRGKLLPVGTSTSTYRSGRA